MAENQKQHLVRFIRTIDTTNANLKASNLEDQISSIQADYGQEWDLLSLAPAGNDFPSDTFIAIWERDGSVWDDQPNEGKTEDHPQDTASVDVSDVSGYPWAGTREYFDGRQDVVNLTFGSRIQVNGVIFQLTQFGQDADESAMVQFRPLDELSDEFQQVQLRRGWIPPMFVPVPPLQFPRYMGKRRG